MATHNVLPQTDDTSNTESEAVVHFSTQGTKSDPVLVLTVALDAELF